MDRTTILESVYETVKDSLEWAETYEEKYYHYIDGVISMSENLLKKLNRTVNVDEEK